MADEKKISDLAQASSAGDLDEFVVVNKAVTEGQDASASGQTSKITFGDLKNAVGTQGATGPMGAKGEPGATGAAGANGATGAKGAPGANGANGANGATGQKGATGATGQKGAPGANGATGQKGAPGATGVGGATGQKGAPGATGPAGTFSGSFSGNVSFGGGLATIKRRSSSAGGWLKLASHKDSGTNPTKFGYIESTKQDTFGLHAWRGGDYDQVTRIGDHVATPINTTHWYTQIRGHIILQDGNASVIMCQQPNQAGQDGNFIIRIPTSSTTEAVRDNLRLQFSNGNLGIRGGLTQNAGAVFDGSDARIKKDITPLESGDSLDTIMKLNPVSFNYKDEEANGDHKMLGLIAQEVEPILPNIVGEMEDWDEDTGDECKPECELDEPCEHREKTIYKTIAYGKLIAVVISAMQKQQEEINELKAKLAE